MYVRIVSIFRKSALKTVLKHIDFWSKFLRKFQSKYRKINIFENKYIKIRTKNIDIV